jgi:4-amino-4-deoxy-L-arabinose transferase-like glycosyltransferase
MSTHGPEGLRPADLALLALLCLVLFGFTLVENQVLTTHEAVHCQNVREMWASHDWIIPTYGGRPWLERPPLPHWATGAFVALVGHPEQAWAYRGASVLAGMLIVLMTSWMASRWYGRGIGLLAGVILATMREFTHYAEAPECDIFLCLLVAAALALFVRLEFVRGPAVQGERHFVGRRPWEVLAFFILLGLTNSAKGLFFGMFFVVLPAGGYLAWNWNADRRACLRYVWLWGWLAFALAALAWPLAAYLRHPGIVDLWMSDYAGRLKGYLEEPAWYYLVQLPWILMPWTLPAAVGLWLSRAGGLPQRNSPARFLWCWAILPVAFFSLSKGKHHHYLLHGMAPWAVLAALGAARLWQWALAAPRWLRHPALGVIVLGLPGALAVVLFRSRLPGPTWLLPALVAGVPAGASAFWWACTRSNARLAVTTLAILLVACHWLTYDFEKRYMDRYRDDSAFVKAVRRLAAGSPDCPLLVAGDTHPLNGSWLLFYLGDRARLLHNLSFLRGDDLPRGEVLVVARAGDAAALEEFGTARIVLQSRATRGESTPADRYALFRLRYRSDLVRCPSDVYISPMQATGRALGPYLHVH